MSILFLILFLLYFIFYSPILMVRIAKYGKSVLKPNFRKALEKMNGDNEIGRILVQHKGFIVLNAISYYILWLIWLAIIGGIIFGLTR